MSLSDRLWYKTRSRSQGRSDGSTDCHTMILASLVPDEIIYNVYDNNIRNYNGAVILGDVSGFTDLSEKFNKAGMGGPSRLSQILNGYIGSMVQEILIHDGDILKFSGDAFLATWKVDAHHLMHECVNDALECAMIIQKNYGQFETDAQVILRVKLGLAAGEMFFSTIGTEVMKHYAIAGEPIWDVKLAEYLCSSGDIIVSPKAWEYVNMLEYLHEYMPDGKHVKVIGLGPSWKNIRKIKMQRHEEEQDNEEKYTFPITYSDRIPEPEAAPLLMVLTGEKMETKPVTYTEFQLRPSMNEAVKKGLKDALRAFILKPVRRGIDNDEPLEYLTEMRQVVIVFVNLIITLTDVERLLNLVNETYKHVCRLVIESHGCVNKVSLFDKDVMLLIIFGLRGFKHDLESQVALRCATNIREVLITLPDVVSASIGVTTGMTYCGVVGHSLRREYTVIGTPVNKAARLMVAYPGKVTCDRDTFLHARLDACHFILQEPKELKGLSSIGPIYEFKEQSQREPVRNDIHMFPLLGRRKELRMFRKLLVAMLEGFHDDTKFDREMHNAMLIVGEPRIGKTRLLDEMLYCTDEGVPLHRIAFSVHDFQVPFAGIQRIFTATLGLSECTTPKEKEERIINKIGHTKYKSYLCCLNSIFNVNFEIAQLCRNLTHNKRDEMLKKVLGKLFSVCFSQIWVIGLDNCECMDLESWKLFPNLLDEHRAFFVMTLGKRQHLCDEVRKVIEHPRIYITTLSGINKWFLAGLACQLLDVWAIPSELEKIILRRSNGNPGWVESYLISLIQTGHLIIRSIKRQKIKHMGLVVPPLSMIMRREKESLIGEIESEQLVGCKKLAKSSSADDDIEFDGEGWQMYNFSYQDCRMSFEEELEKGRDMDERIAVCTLDPKFKLEDVSVEITMDVMMLKMFDSLSTSEQLLLKCSSIIGDTFTRHMMESLMNNPAPRNVALSVKRLFEVRIIACANGDFTDSPNFMLMQQRLYSSIQEYSLQCDCIGIIIDKSCEDLPRYASCGYLKFRMPLFRETTYNLLTDQQKKDLHSKAIKYLKRETKRCKSCGGGNFLHILGHQREDYGLHAIPGDYQKRQSVVERNVRPDNRNSLIAQINYEEMILDKISHSSVGDPVLPVSSGRSVVATRSIEVTTPPDRRRFSCGFPYRRRSEKVQSYISIARSFSSVDFTNCKCYLILTSMYTQLLEHCRQTGYQDQTMEALLEYSEVCITSCNFPQAVRLLDDAQMLLSTEPSDEDSAIPKWKFPLIRGKINTLLGLSRLELGQLEQASQMLLKAMHEFGHPFPTHPIKIHMACLNQMLKQMMMIKWCPRWLVGQAEGYDAVFCNEMSDCLSVLCTLFLMTRQWKSAKLASVWSLNEALEANDDFYCLCTGYTNLIEIAHHYRNTDICWRLERAAFETCRRKSTSVESQELEAVCRLYFSIFKARLKRAEINRAICIGFKTLRISKTIHSIILRLRITAVLIEALTFRLRLSEAVSLLNDMEFAAAEDTDKTSRVWFYAKCVGLQLDTGFALLPFKQCEQFYQQEGDSIATIRNPDAERRYFVVMWLWSLRNEDWEAATVWYTRAREKFELRPDDTLANVITALRYLEGLLLRLVSKVDTRNISAITDAYSDINTLIDKINKSLKTCDIGLPRFLIYKAYYRHIRFHDRAAIKQLKKAKDIALKQNNLLDAAWAEHNEKVWNGTISPIFLEYWKEHCRGEDIMDWHEADMGNQKMMLYSLPVPRYTA